LGDERAEGGEKGGGNPGSEGKGKKKSLDVTIKRRREKNSFYLAAQKKREVLHSGFNTLPSW